MSDVLAPKRNKPITKDRALIGKKIPGGEMTLEFAQFVENISDILSHFQVGDGDPTGSLETSFKMIFIRQDGGVGSTLYVNELGDGTSDGWRAL